MLPLLLVYIAEYTINQGVAPTLLFPIRPDTYPSTTPAPPFIHTYRDFYPLYALTYQTGVFISRSSTPLIRIHALYPPSLLQFANLILLTSHAIYPFLPNIYCVLAVIFWEGLLGGLVYVSTFAEITDRARAEEREFSLAVVTVGDSGGICVAAVVGMGLEGGLCGWQVGRGRDWCRRV